MFWRKYDKFPSIRLCSTRGIHKLTSTVSYFELLEDKKPVKTCCMLTEEKLDKIGMIFTNHHRKHFRSFFNGFGTGVW
jgi:hypothetical protein